MKDTICACGHWFEEHYVEGDKHPCDTCATAQKDDGLIGDPCPDFVFSPEDNTPESIADRGGEHDLDSCDCALCAWSRKKFIGDVRRLLVEGGEWRVGMNGSAFIETVRALLDEVNFGSRPHEGKDPA